MKIVKLKAGLGNQMFQYAFYKLLLIKYDIKDAFLDISYFSHKDYQKYLKNGLEMTSATYIVANKNDLKKISVPYNGFKPHHFLHRLVSLIQMIFNKHYFFEKNRGYIDPSSILKYSYFDGYWQSWRYLEPIRKELIADFLPKHHLSTITKNAIQNLQTKNSVFIGIRKGDYSQSSKSVKHYGLPSISYYDKAINLIKSRVVNPYFVIFSDDIDWVKNNINFKAFGIENDALEFREKESVFNDFEELYVMASCKHAIVSNSTYNFWGAWLISNNNKIVVAPKEWFKDGKPIDIIPPDWIQI